MKTNKETELTSSMRTSTIAQHRTNCKPQTAINDGNQDFFVSIISKFIETITKMLI